MGSEFGYEYRYGFSMVDEDEIKSEYKSEVREGVKAFIFEIRTNFVVLRRSEEGEEERELIDSERFDTSVDEDETALFLHVRTRYRLKEYWMTAAEITLFACAALAFAKQMAACPQHASLSLIPVVVSFEVCTVQQEGESYEATMDRAICNQRLVPLYLWPLSTIVDCKPTKDYLMRFLRNLRRIRVENTDEGLALMRVCRICSRSPSIGAQISLLPCHHAFHSHCIVQWLEDNNLCPSCDSPAYHNYIAVGPTNTAPNHK